MARKVFLSFLGAIKYDPTAYTIGSNFRSNVTCFAQEAIIQYNFGKDVRFDDVYVFATNDAEQNNYTNRNNGYGKPLIPNDGLERVLTEQQKRGAIVAFEKVHIAEGYATKEIWEVFGTVLKQLKEGDEVTLDITYGFRSLPMLGLVLLHYAKILRGIKVDAIWYGAFEAGRGERDIKRKEAEANGMTKAEADEKIYCEAPILDLKPFAELQEWINAAQTFEKAGDPSLLAELMYAAGAKEQANEMCVFFDALRSVRGRLLTTEDIDLERVIAAMEGDINPEIAPFVAPIVEKMRAKIAPFAPEKLENGFAAVQWCIDNNLVQQGYTFLQETTKSYVVWKAMGDLDLAYSQDYRDCANGALSTKVQHGEIVIGYGKIKYKATEDMEPITKFARSKQRLCKEYTKLTGEGLRNDISHGGFKTDYANSRNLKAGLQEIYTNICRELL